MIVSPPNFLQNRTAGNKLPISVLEKISSSNTYHPRVYIPFKGCGLTYNFYNKYKDNIYSKLIIDLKNEVFDIIIFFPQVRKGGTDKLLISYLQSIKKYNSDISILVFVENESEEEWIEAIKENAKIIFLSRYLIKGNNQAILRSALSTYLVMYPPKVIWGFNSRLAWILIKEFGPGFESKIWFVCFAHWVHEHSFREFGMLHDYLPDCLTYIDYMVSDNRTFLNYLNLQYGLNDANSVFLPAVINHSGAFENQEKRRTLKLLWASGIEWNKGIDTLISISAFADQYDFEIDIFGTPKNQSGNVLLNQLINAISANKRINYLGGFEGFASLEAKKYDAFLFTSIIEGMPNILLEAAEDQMFIIATDVGGVGEVIIDNETGYLIKDIFDVEEYIQKIKNLKELTNADYNKIRCGLYNHVKQIHEHTFFCKQFKRLL